jgi:methylphosphotriester-DNA--protein-cysteine methyltransferase
MLGTAIKTCALYSAAHPVTRQAVGHFVAVLRPFLAAYGAFAVRVMKNAFYVDGLPLKGGALGTLATYLYARRVIYLRLLPEVDEPALEALVTTLAMDRQALEAAGGVAFALAQAGASHVQVDEMSLEEEQELRTLDLGAITELLERRIPTPDDRERILDVVRSGPERTARLLERAFEAASGIAADLSEADRLLQALHIVRSLDRAILEEPFEEQGKLHATLAEAWGQVAEPLRSLLARGLRLDDGLATRLAGPRSAEARGVREAPPEYAFPPAPPAFPDAEERLRRLLTLDEAETNREVVRTLLDMLRHEADDREMAEAVDALGGYLPWLIEQREFELLRTVLEQLTALAAAAGTARGKAAAFHVRRIAQEALFDQLFDALWMVRGGPGEAAARRCFEPLVEAVVPTLVRRLREERRGGMRILLCDLLVHLGAARTEDLVPLVDDPQWYVVRNAVRILGRLRDPAAVPHVARLAAHPDARVRREAVDALAAVPTAEAQRALARFLDDPDERLRVRALVGLQPPHVWELLPRLLALLEDPDPLGRQAEVRGAVLKVLMDLRAWLPPDSVDAVWFAARVRPVVRRLALAPAVGARARAVRRMAITVARLLGREADESRPPAPAAEGQGT